MSNVEILISEQDVRARIGEIAALLSEKYEGREVELVGVLNGSVFFITALAQAMTIPVELDFMSVSSYGSGTESTGNVVIEKNLSRPIKGKSVIVVEDIVDTGRTLKTLCGLFKEQEPESLEVVTLLDKPDRRVVDFKADYVGFQIPDAFVVGWGLDYDQKYRDLTFVGVLNEEN